MADTQREQLIKILEQDYCPSSYVCDENCKYADLESCYEARTADYLLEHGVIVPPCKVGDVLYELDIFTDYEKCHRCDYYYAGGMGDSPECEKGRYGQRAKECIEIKEKEATQKEILWLLYTNSFGKTVFLTREDAELALKDGTSQWRS